MIYYCLGGYQDPTNPSDFCTTMFPDGNMQHFTENAAREASKNIYACAGSALYVIDTDLGKGKIIDQLDSNESYAPLLVQHEYLKDKPIRVNKMYSCRAECSLDIELFLTTAKEHGLVIECNQIIPDQQFTDTEIEFQSSSTLEQIQTVLNDCVDCHVMLETLREVPLSNNSLERDWAISERFLQ